MRLYLVRHAIAEDSPKGARFADPVRALTAKGRRRFRRSARRFAELGEEVDAIFTSPVLRAVQTAEILAGALHSDDVQVMDELHPDGAPAPLLSRLARLSARSVALVGHNRLLCEIAAMLADVPFEDAARIRLKRGSILRIDVRKLGAAASGKARWWLAADGDSPLAGLPLDRARAAAT